MVTHSSIFAWEIPWTEESGGRQSIGSHRIGHDKGLSTHTLKPVQTGLNSKGVMDSPWFPSSDRSRFKSCIWHLLWELEHVIFSCFSHLYSKNCDTCSNKADLGIKDEIHL